MCAPGKGSTVHLRNIPSFGIDIQSIILLVILFVGLILSTVIKSPGLQQTTVVEVTIDYLSC